MRGTVSDFKIARTRSDWVRFTAVILAAVLALGNAARFAGQHNWISMALALAGGLSFVVLAFMAISTNPRVRRWVTWRQRTTNQLKDSTTKR